MNPLRLDSGDLSVPRGGAALLDRVTRLHFDPKIAQFKILLVHLEVCVAFEATIHVEFFAENRETNNTFTEESSTFCSSRIDASSGPYR